MFKFRHNSSSNRGTMPDKDIDSPSQPVMSDYTTPVLLSLPPEVQGMVASFVRVIWGHELRMRHNRFYG